MKKLAILLMMSTVLFAANKNNLVLVTSYNDIDVSRFGKKPLVAAHDLYQALSDEIYKAHKFRLLDRNDQAHLDTESNFIKERVNSDKALRLGRNLGADYLMIYEVTKMAQQKGQGSQFSANKSASKLELNAKVRVIMLATTEIKYSKSFHIEKTYKVLDTNAYEDFIASSAAQISAAFHDGVYPPKVEKILNGEGIFTQKLEQGSVLECYHPGVEVKDSRTGEKSYAENYSANVQVVRINEQQSYAKVLKGSLRVGDICHIMQVGADGANTDAANSGEFVPSSYGDGF